MSRRQYWMTAGLVVVAAFAGGIVSGLVFMGQSSPAKAAAGAATVVKASEFQLVDARGTLRASLGWTETNEPMLKLFGANGEIRAGFFLVDDTPFVSLWNQNDVLQAQFFIHSEEGPGLHLYGSDENVRGVFGINSETDEATVTLVNKHGNLVWEAP
ncbi:MAG: hypothetical protein AB1742_06365 [bacterium]